MSADYISVIFRILTYAPPKCGNNDRILDSYQEASNGYLSGKTVGNTENVQTYTYVLTQVAPNIRGYMNTGI